PGSSAIPQALPRLPVTAESAASGQEGLPDSRVRRRLLSWLPAAAVAEGAPPPLQAAPPGLIPLGAVAGGPGALRGRGATELGAVTGSCTSSSGSPDGQRHCEHARVHRDRKSTRL